jgi:hypothetical protein
MKIKIKYIYLLMPSTVSVFHGNKFTQTKEKKLFSLEYNFFLTTMLVFIIISCSPCLHPLFY